MIDSRSPLRQRRDLSEIIRASLQIYTQFFLAFFSIAAVIIPLGIANGIFSDRLEDSIGGALIIAALGVAQLFVNQLVAAALLVAIDDVENGKVPEFGRAYDVAFARFGALIAALLRVAFHAFLFAITIVGLPWAIQRLIRWAFVSQAVMLNGADPKSSLSVSAAAVEGSWWRTFGCLIAIGVPALMIGLVSVTFPSRPIALTSTTIAALSALIVPFGVIAATLLYFDLNVRKEAPAPTEPPASEEEIS